MKAAKGGGAFPSSSSGSGQQEGDIGGKGSSGGSVSSSYARSDLCEVCYSNITAYVLSLIII